MARRSLDESLLRQIHDHLMYCRRGDIEIMLYIRHGRSLAVELGVVINERKVLSLLWREARWHGDLDRNLITRFKIASVFGKQRL